MFIAQCKTVGSLISPLSPSFLLLYCLDKAPACQAPGWHKAMFHPTETSVMAFLPSLKCPPCPPCQNPNLSTNVSLFFIPFFLNTAQEEPLEGQEKAQFTNHNVPCLLKETWRQAILTFWASHRTLNSDAETLCDCDRLQDNESTVQLPLPFTFPHSPKEVKHHPSPHAKMNHWRAKSRFCKHGLGLVMD